MQEILLLRVLLIQAAVVEVVNKVQPQMAQQAAPAS